PGVSAADAERLLVKPLETELDDVEGLEEMTGIASENHASVLMKFAFGWERETVLADVRERVQRAEAEFPDDADKATISEINISEFPIMVVSLSGAVPERTLLRLSKDLQRKLETLSEVLEADLSGHRDEMVEVLIDPLAMESYGVTVADLYNVVERNNALVPAGQIEGPTGQFSISVPGNFTDLREVSALPVLVDGDRIVSLADIAEIRQTFEDRTQTSRLNGESTMTLRVSKRTGENIIATTAVVRAAVNEEVATWPEPLRQAVEVDFALEQAKWVEGMIQQLESAVLTAVILVMIVVLAALGFRSAILVGIAIPSSFLLTFALMAALGMSVNNMTMFGLILAVGMLVDGAIVVVEYADKRRRAGDGPMVAYTAAAKRMFWPVVASTGTTLCAFLPMLFWPGMAGEFMGQLPVTIIFVLSASLIVALIYLPVLGGVSGRISRLFGGGAHGESHEPEPRYRRSTFGRMVSLIVMNPIGPVVAIGLAVTSIFSVFTYYGASGTLTEFFTAVDTDRANIYVRARGNYSLEERDRLVRLVEHRIDGIEGIRSVFAFAGETTGDGAPEDAIGQVQLELTDWRTRPGTGVVLDKVRAALRDLPGFYADVKEEQEGPQQGKPVQLELTGTNFDTLEQAAEIATVKFRATEGLIDIDDTRPLPGIEWQIAVDRAAAGRFGADILSVGPLIQFITRGALIDELRSEDSDDELEIRARFPAEARTLDMLDTLRVPTAMGTVPLSNFAERYAREKTSSIQRV
ncbi:MAG: efflux RND transporter permease subunit, partial [Pseudomonadota bacterium]